MVRKVKEFFSRKERKLLTDVEEIGYFASSAGLSCKKRRFASAGRKDRDGGLCFFSIRICGPADLRRTLSRPGMKGCNLSSRVIRDDQTLCGISIAENADAVGANAFSAEMFKVISAVTADSAPNQRFAAHALHGDGDVAGTAAEISAHGACEKCGVEPWLNRARYLLAEGSGEGEDCVVGDGAGDENTHGVGFLGFEAEI